MLQVFIPGQEFWDEQCEQFKSTKPIVLQLEHSLVSISKWEAKWKVPFLDKRQEKTREQTLDYIRCMTITQNVDPLTYAFIPNDVIEQITKYIDDPMTATWFSKEQERKAGINREIVTAELIYYWMIACQIPFECQKWHLNRLLTLIKVCSVKNEKPKPMSKKALASRNSALNAARRARMGSKG